MKKPLLKGMATLVVLFLIMLLSTNALADSFAEPKPSKIELENGSKVFYMTPPKYVGDIYPQSGLYYNTEPPEPIYLISSNHSGISYFNEFNVFISNNGMSFAHIPISWHNDNAPWNNKESWQTGQEDNNEYLTAALEFYEKGNLINQYTVSDLVTDNSKLEFSVTMVMWEKGNSRSFDPESNTLSIKTVDGITYTFDITTGAILESDKEGLPISANKETGINDEQLASGNFITNGYLLWLGLGVFCAALIIILILLIAKKRKSA